MYRADTSRTMVHLQEKKCTNNIFTDNTIPPALRIFGTIGMRVNDNV